MRNLTRFLANLANQDLYDYQVRFVEELERRMEMANYVIYDSGKALGAPDIKRVIFSDLYTIVIWNDGTKTIVKCMDEKFDKEKGLAMCIAKKSLGNKGKYYDVFKKWIKENEEER